VKKVMEMKDIHGKWIIEENRKYKVLKFDNSTYSIINKKGIFTHGYWDFFIPLIDIFNDPSLLLIGLGGGTLIYQIREFLKKNVDIEAVEISNTCIEISRIFYPQLKNEKIYHGDGFDFVKNSKKKYDIIILDAYIYSNIPKDFLSREFVSNVYKILKDRGIFVVNYALTYSGRMNFKEFLNILKEKFSVSIVKTYFSELNVIIIGTKGMNLDEINLERKYPWMIKYRYGKLKNI